MAVDLAMLSLVQAIIAAEAGVKANVESMAAAINILISNLSRLERKPANCWLSGYAFSPRYVSGRRHFCMLRCNAGGATEALLKRLSASAARQCCRLRSPRHTAPCRVAGPDT